MPKTVVQLDFDGTVTEDDVSFLMLDEYVGKDWRKHLDEYKTGDITVGAFNKIVFGRMKQDEKTLTNFVLSDPRVQVRPGLKEFVEYCRSKDIEVVIVSNGLIFYIEALLKQQGITGLEIHAAENAFYETGVQVRYLGPDSQEVESGFKEVYTDYLCQKGYQVIYIGNGTSDIYPARKARHVCATADLLEICNKEKVKCYPFNDFFDAIKIVENLKLD
ncbi:MAG: HAD-IB family phosphatase [Dehalococcoidales bacterium]|nr:HAD-IB family phosphatase [Dehalococcoidales bacterium]